MIDGIKLFYIADENTIENIKSKIEFIGYFSITTGEIKNKFISKNNSIEISIIGEKNIIIQGSLHKYYCNGDNSGDFTFNDLTKAINKLCNELGLRADEIKIQRLEIGFNVRGSPISFYEIEDNIIAYKLQPFEPYKIEGKNFGYHCKLQRFEIKIYNKALQYGLNDEVIRFEYKIFKMTHIEKLGVRYLSDLTNKSKITHLLQAFIRDFKNIKMDNKVQMDKAIKNNMIPLKDLIFYLEARNSKHWNSLKRSQKSSTITSHKRRFERILKQFTNYSLTDCIISQLEQKFHHLILT